MKIFIFSSILYMVGISMTGCRKMPPIPPCSIPQIRITAIPSSCEDSCSVTFIINKEIEEDGSMFLWSYQIKGLTYVERTKDIQVNLPAGKYIIKVEVRNEIRYCVPLEDTIEYTVSGGAPEADFRITPDSNGLCVLSNCPGTCMTKFINTSKNSDSVRWTFRGQNGKGVAITSRENNPSLPDVFNQPDTILVKLEALKPPHNTSEKIKQVIIRPETYVSEILNVSNEDLEFEKPFLIAENGGNIYLGVANPNNLTISAVKKAGKLPENFIIRHSSSAFKDFDVQNNAIKSRSNNTPNRYFLSATVYRVSDSLPVLQTVRLDFGSGIGGRSETIAPLDYSTGNGVVESISSTNELLFCGQKLIKKTPFSVADGIVFTRTTLNLNLISPRIPKSTILNIQYLIEDGTAYWAYGTIYNSGNQENCLLKLGLDYRPIDTFFLGFNNLVAKKLIKSGENILIIGSQAKNGAIYSINTTIKNVNYVPVFIAEGWELNDALLRDNILLCIGGKTQGLQARAASIRINLSTKSQLGAITYYDVPSSMRSVATCMNKAGESLCGGVLIAGYAISLIDGIEQQNSFFAKTDINGFL